MEKIDVRIPFTTKGNLGHEVNRIMLETKQNWVLLIDHDVFLCHPHWYYMCQKAIDLYPDTGLFTCWTNRSVALDKRMDIAVDSNNMEDHYYEAKRLFLRFGYECTKVTDLYCSGAFMLIRKIAWEASGGYPGHGIENEVCIFAKRLIENKWKIRLMQGMYIYHLKNEFVTSWIKGITILNQIPVTTCNLKAER